MCDSNYKMYGGKKLSHIIPQLCKKKVFTDMLLEQHKEIIEDGDYSEENFPKKLLNYKDYCDFAQVFDEILLDWISDYFETVDGVENEDGYSVVVLESYGVYSVTELEGSTGYKLGFFHNLDDAKAAATLLLP